MVGQIFDETILLYGFALFFIFFVLIVMIVRYSNKELAKKLVFVYENMNSNEKDMRHLAEAQMRAKNELKKEIFELEKKVEKLQSQTTVKKSKARAR